MATGIGVPLEVAMLLCIGTAVAGVWIGQRRSHLRPDPHCDPLRELRRPSAFAQAADLAARRNAVRSGSHAVLRARIDQFTRFSHTMDADERDQVRVQIAAVMRAGLRRHDRIGLADGDGFTILIPGADERAAARIADRLRGTLAQLRLPQFGKDTRFTASFGVAADRSDEDIEIIEHRARRALRAAVSHGEGHVIPASEIEEVMYLPAPSHAPAASAA